jgi:hypothetical protein
MLTKAVAVVKENQGMSATVLAVVAMLGGGVAITLPADEKIAELKTEFVQFTQYSQEYHRDWEQKRQMEQLDEIDWRMTELMREVERLETLPQYLDRPLNSQEKWKMQQAIEDWNALKQRRNNIINQ